MLVCPQCEFENPNTNKFCQECGASLTQNSCPECNSLVSFNSINCQDCGAIAGVIWWAQVVGNPASAGSEISLEPAPTADGAIAYLDAQKRYQILETLPPVGHKGQEKCLRVLDCQPFQLSPLEALIRQEEETFELEAAMMSTGNSAEDSSSAPSPKVANPVGAMTMPNIAQPYLRSSQTFYPALPFIHDAWQQNGQQILLLEDRSQFSSLIDLWLNEELLIPQLQLLHWLYEMVELWDILEPLNCCQSLLEISNLRVDEDQAICLQRLHVDEQTMPPTLTDLGQCWQMLFAESQRTQLGAVSLLLADLEIGNLISVDDVRSRIEAIAHDLQATHSDFDMTPKFDGLDSSDMSTASPVTEAEASGTGSADLSIVSIDQEVTKPIEDEAESESDDLPTVVLPMQLFHLEDVGRTDIGRQRDHNEDYFGIETQMSRLESPSGKTVHAHNLYILCDGMGGHAGGEVASALAVDTLRQFFKEKWQSSSSSKHGSNSLPGIEVLSEAVQLANKAIFDVNQQNARSGSGRMGTTLVMALILDTEVAVVHVGDSRLYRFTRKRGLEQITVDHEVGQREMQRGVDPEIAYARPDAYQLTQALGPRDENFIKPDIQYFELNEDSLLLLCSDGLSDNDLLENNYKTHIEPFLSSQTNLDHGVCQLIELANQYNGHDNITAIAIRAKVRPNLDHIR